MGRTESARPGALSRVRARPASFGGRRIGVNDESAHHTSAVSRWDHYSLDVPAPSHSHAALQCGR